MDQDTILTTLYVVSDDFCQSHGFEEKHHPGPAASLSCSEVVMLAVFGQWVHFKSERAFYHYAVSHWRVAFPTLPGREQFNRLQRSYQEAIAAFSQFLMASTRAIRGTALVPERTPTMVPKPTTRSLVFRIAAPELLALLLVLLVLLAACGGEDIQPINEPHKPYRIVQVCIDPWYPYVRPALNTVAGWTQNAITVNQDGLHLFADMLSSAADTAMHDFANITISPFLADPPDPGDSGNPWGSATDHADWQDALKAQHAQLDQEKMRLAPQLEKLRTFTPAPSSVASQALTGCLMIAHLRFASESGQHILIIAASSEYSLPKLGSSFLPGVTVEWIDRYTPSASKAYAEEQRIKQTFLSLGAASISLYDAAETAPSPF